MSIWQLLSTLRQLQEEPEKSGLTERWKLRKRFAFLAVRLYTLQVQYD